MSEERHGSTNQKVKETLGDRENDGNRNRLTENLILAVNKKKKSSKWFLSLGFPTKTVHASLISLKCVYIPQPYQPS
jgi:hypothetical protein